MRRLILIALMLTTVAAAAAFRQAGKKEAPGDRAKREIERTLLRLEDERAQVDVTNDRAVFERIIAHDFVSTSASGKFRNRQGGWMRGSTRGSGARPTAT